MLRFRQSNLRPRATRVRLRHSGGRAGFTLIELIFVMVLLAIGAAMVAPAMASFYRGRLLNSEARRLLTLANYGQSRAIAEGVPVVLWINAAESTYGLSVIGPEVDGEERRGTTTFATDPTIKLDTPSTDTPATSELDDETLGITDGLPVIRFNPDGFYDESSVRKILLRQGEGNENALEVGQTANRLGYEIRPATAN